VGILRDDSLFNDLGFVPGSVIGDGKRVTVIKKTPKLRRKENQRPNSPPAASAAESESELDPPLKFAVVGIGASAGGLEAYKRFFSTMPADSGMAFILVPHLDPSHRSLMVELVMRETAMKVCEAADQMKIEPNCVYIIPPNKFLTIRHNQLRLAKSETVGRPTIALDGFFRSLAEDQAENAIGIILSGTGNHGTTGLKEINGAGGLTIAQDPTTAEYAQMPQSAIDAGFIDCILAPEKMPQMLMKYVRPPISQLPTSTRASEADEQLIAPVLELLRTSSRFDFRFYRKNMLKRRIERRMRILQTEQMGDYVSYLQNSPDELVALCKDLLIGVTSFFRDPDAFEFLNKDVISDLVQRQAGEIPVRVWVPACSSGEEAYSIAILLLEQFAAAKRPANIQIFATDIDDESVDGARRGIYPASAVAGLSPERIKRFFVAIDDQHFQVSKELRASIVVTRQDINSDAPLSRLDLISCRNLLIYLEPDLQQKVLSVFHFSLNERGILFLGCSESIGRHTDLFETVNKKWRIYRRVGPSRHDLVQVPIIADAHQRIRIPKIETGTRRRPGVADVMHKLLLAQYAPAAALVNRNLEVLNLSGRTSDYLELPPGEITKNLMSLVRKGLRSRIRIACQQVLDKGESPTSILARVFREGSTSMCDITVTLLHEPREMEGLLLVVFQDCADSPPSNSPRELGPEDESAIVRELEHEVETTREDLQSSIEELQTSNEEVMSMNEELQSANEELETSKEELQSYNEELTTVNSQLQEKMEELERANNDFRNLLMSTEIATVFLDKDLRIVRFTPATGELLHLLESDIGRPIRDFAFRFTDQTLLQDTGRVLDKLVPVETEICSEAGRFYLRRILPYRTSSNHVEGVAITFVDISERNSLQRELLTIAAEETRRIGQDLHDSVGQALTGLGMLAGTLAETLEATCPEDAKAAHRIASGLTNVLGQVRKLSKGLAPVEVQVGGLFTALADFAEATTQDSTVTCDFESHGQDLLVEHETATHLYRIVQEAVTNAVKAGADHVTISLDIDDNQVELRIRDNGIGISTTARNSQGMGLKTMQYRAGLLGGTLSIGAMKKGTLVTCHLFLNRKPDGAPTDH